MKDRCHFLTVHMFFCSTLHKRRQLLKIVSEVIVKSDLYKKKKKKKKKFQFRSVMAVWMAEPKDRKLEYER